MIVQKVWVGEDRIKRVRPRWLSLLLLQSIHSRRIMRVPSPTPGGVA